MGQVGQGHLDDPLALAPGFPQQDGRRRVTVGDDIDIHGVINSIIIANNQENNAIYMGTIIQPKNLFIA
jgi:hypothetical protein